MKHQILLLGSAVSLLLAGCGSDSSTGSGSTSMSAMSCNYSGNCSGNGPAPRSLSVGSSTYDVVQTGEMPKAAADRLGSFRTLCDVSHFAYADPIVFPGQLTAGHLHMFFGNTSANGKSTYQSLKNNGNGTCRGGIANRSAYWVPALLDGSGEAQLPYEMHVYYKSGFGIDDASQIQVMPDGLKMVVGNAMATAPQGSEKYPSTNSVHWECNDVASNSVGDCYGTLEMVVVFNQCSSGALDSSDHKSHVIAAEGGGCFNPDFPVTLPEITYRVLFNVAGTADWRLSSDTYEVSNGNGGYSLHGDWMEAWAPEVKQSFIDNCSSKANTTCGSHIIGGGNVLH